MIQTITIEKLEELCSEYDQSKGNWPESKKEGAAVFQYIFGSLQLAEPPNALRIKPAAEIAALAAKQVTDAKAEKNAKITAFINDVVVPKIEEVIRDENNYGSVSFPVQGSDPAEFVAAVADVLVPLGYSVKQSHDGGGLYATIVIGWVPQPYTPIGSTRVRIKR